MTPSRSDLTLPGDIPGLLRRGSPVLRHPLGSPVVPSIEAALCHGVEMRPRRGGDGEELCVDLGGDYPAPMRWWPAARVSLDLTDPTGRAHAAWWLARWWQQHRASGATVYPLMGTVWHRCGDTSWRLSWCYTDTTWGLVVPSAPSYVEVPTLADMAGVAPDDPHTLPDGSRWVDAEALRRVVLHVAGRTP